MNLLLAGVGASLGAGLRYFVTNYGKKHWEKKQIFPMATLFINLTGSFMLGLIFGMQVNVFCYALIGTGVLGGYTTFSTLNNELVGLVHKKNWRGFIGYALASYLGGIILVILGFYVGHLL